MSGRGRLAAEAMPGSDRPLRDEGPERGGADQGAEDEDEADHQGAPDLAALRRCADGRTRPVSSSS